jgi:hypothetical protein
MKRTLMAGFAALALTGVSFAQAGNQGAPQDQKSKDDTTFQKGHTDPTERTKQQKDDEKKKGKTKTGKNKKGPIDPTNPNPQGNGPTVPNPTPTTPPTTR